MTKPKFYTLYTGTKIAKNIRPNWIASDADGHLRAHRNKPVMHEKLGTWISDKGSWDIGFYRNRHHWKTTLRRIEYD